HPNHLNQTLSQCRFTSDPADTSRQGVALTQRPSVIEIDQQSVTRSNAPRSSSDRNQASDTCPFRYHMPVRHCSSAALLPLQSPVSSSQPSIAFPYRTLPARGPPQCTRAMYRPPSAPFGAYPRLPGALSLAASRSSNPAASKSNQPNTAPHRTTFALSHLSPHGTLVQFALSVLVLKEGRGALAILFVLSHRSRPIPEEHEPWDCIRLGGGPVALFSFLSTPNLFGTPFPKLFHHREAITTHASTNISTTNKPSTQHCLRIRRFWLHRF
ncbi:hypothetical protein GQ607_003970, partial [Colletotrichum asianum]